MDKTTLRKILKERRKNNKNKALFDEMIFNKLKLLLNDFNNIGSYYSLDDEVSTYNINKWILDNNKNLYLPKVNGDYIDFYNVKNIEDVSIGSYNINEPNGNNKIDINDLDCIIVPMLGFNKDNYRIGFGKGYYDRALRNYKGYKLGIAYSFQESDEIVVEEYDVVLDEIITE